MRVGEDSCGMYGNSINKLSLANMLYALKSIGHSSTVVEVGTEGHNDNHSYNLGGNFGTREGNYWLTNRYVIALRLKPYTIDR